MTRTELASRAPLFERLPEIYRTRDVEQSPPDALREYLEAVEIAFGAIHENIEALYDDLFIETCADWVVPYLADLVGTTHLKGDPRTLRMDVADTIALRRRKGTLIAIERLAANLTGWGCRCVELRENLSWSQHLNHQRPDAGGEPPYGAHSTLRIAVPRGGTVPVRDPATLSLLGTPFDPFAYTADVKSAADGALHINLPDLAIFLWRLSAYRVRQRRPLAKGVGDLGMPAPGSGLAHYALRFDLDPLDRRVRLFNTGRSTDGVLTAADNVPGAIAWARLTGAPAAGDPVDGNPAAYVSVDPFNELAALPDDFGFDLSDLGLQFYLPESVFATTSWTFRGDNLCGWESGLRRPLRAHEIVIDPGIGRVLIGADGDVERDAMIDSATGGSRIYCGYTYGAVGPVGAQPVSRGASPTTLSDVAVVLREVSALPGGTSLQDALADLDTAGAPVVIEIQDSLVHDLDLSTIPGVTTADGPVALALRHSLVIRASGDECPVIRLAQPLRFRPVVPTDPSVNGLAVRFEGLHLARGAGYAAGDPLIARAAVASMEFDGCTLDPGGVRRRDDAGADPREPLWPALALADGYGFGDPGVFAPTPDIVLSRCISGALLLDGGYRLALADSIVDAGGGVFDDPAVARFALSSATDPAAGWGAPLHLASGATFFGRVRTVEAHGRGGVFVQRLEVLENQGGCLKFCWFSGNADRLPPNHACVRAPDARLVFTSEWFGDPGYAQLARETDFRVLSRGPRDDAMGAFGFLLEAHKWTNLDIRLREFMPVGVRPLPLAVT